MIITEMMKCNRSHECCSPIPRQQDSPIIELVPLAGHIFVMMTDYTEVRGKIPHRQTTSALAHAVPAPLAGRLNPNLAERINGLPKRCTRVSAKLVPLLLKALSLLSGHL